MFFAFLSLADPFAARPPIQSLLKKRVFAGRFSGREPEDLKKEYLASEQASSSKGETYAQKICI